MSELLMKKCKKEWLPIKVAIVYIVNKGFKMGLMCVSLVGPVCLNIDQDNGNVRCVINVCQSYTKIFVCTSACV